MAQGADKAGTDPSGAFTLTDVQTGSANYMLGYLQMTIAGGESITPAKWQQALAETVAFQRRMVLTETPTEAA